MKEKKSIPGKPEDYVEEAELLKNICKWTESSFDEYKALKVWQMLGIE